MALTTTAAAGDLTTIKSQSAQFLLHEKGTDMRIGPYDDIIISDGGAAAVTMLSPTTFEGIARFNFDVEDIAGNTGLPGFILKSNISFEIE